MLRLPADLIAEVVYRCTHGHPTEVCGILTGPAGGNHVTGHIPMTNAAANPRTGFAFDADQQLAAYADMDAHGEDPLVIYHSHPRGPATLSPQDQTHARKTPGVVWLLVATSSSPPQVAAWEMVDGAPVKARIEVK